MQLFALKEEQRIFAGHAVKGQHYQCPECLSPVRVRSGPHRKPHFFHAHHSSCPQNGKTIFHINTQLYIQATLPKEEAFLEIPFPSINRIADVVWEKKKLIFEVQYSPISADEVKQRTIDYESLGYQVIWILHEKRFNKKTIPLSEAYLLKKECYFTSIGEYGEGNIYDQFQVVHNHGRLFKGPPLPVKIDQPFLIQEDLLKKSMPGQLLQRKTRKWGFEGDLLHRCQAGSEKEFFSMHHLESRYSTKSSLTNNFRKALLWLQNMYLSFFDALLEKHSS